MINKLVLLTFLILFSLPNYGQVTIEDSTWVDSQLSIVESIRDSSSSHAYQVTQEVLLFSQERNYKYGIIRCFETIATIAAFDDDIDKAFDYFLLALKECEGSQFYTKETIYFRILGNIKFMLGEFPEALNYWMDGLSLAKEHDEFEIIPEFYSNIGNLYFKTKEYERARENFDLSYNTAIEYGRSDLYPNSLINLALVENKENNFSKAIEYSREIIHYVDSVPNLFYFLPAAYEHLGTAYLGQKQYDSSLVNFNSMLKYLKEDTELYFGPIIQDEIKALKGIGQSYLYLKELNKAEGNFKSAYDKSVEINYLPQLNELAELLSIVNEELGHYEVALDYYKIHKSLSDSILGDDKVRELAKVRFDFEKQELLKEEEIRRAKEEIEQKRESLIYRVSVISIFLIALILFLLYRLQRNKTKQSELKRENLRLNIDYKNRELATNVLYILKKNELLLNISEKLKKIRYASKTDSKITIEDVLREIDISSKEIGWEEFELIFKEVHSEFYEKLNKKYPGLSQNEQRLCAFIKLKMTTKEISAITFQTTHSINVARSRMKKKMQIEDNDRLNSILSKL